MKKTLQITNGISFVFMVIINYLSNTGIFNGETMATVSARYDNLFTPASYAFSIWGVIYIGLAAFTVYQTRSLFKKGADDQLVLEIGSWFIISCIANSLWIVAWLYDYTGLSVLLMILLLFSLYKIIVNTGVAVREVTLIKRACTWWSFSLYAGWVSVALLANISAYFTKLQLDGFGPYNVTGAIFIIIIATAIHVVITWKRHMTWFPMAGAWALVAIALAGKSTPPVIFQSTIFAAAIIVINMVVHVYVKKRV